MGALQLDFAQYTDVQLQSDYYRKLPAKNFIQFGVVYINLKKKGKHFNAFHNLLEHFLNYQEEIGRTFSTKDIGKEEIDGFVDYLYIEKNLKTSTIQAMVIKLKYLLNKAYLNGWAIDDSYTDAKVRENESTHIYLKQKEIARLYYYDGLTKKQEEIRDLFIVGCMTGQRYSDYSRISTDNIKGDNIIILQKKTKNKAVVPMTDYVREIFNKYDGHLPKARCIQYFNKALKLICRKAGMTDWITYEEDLGGEIVMVKKQKCDMISSHTARRTFITNTISDKIPENMIMKLTGHKSSACFVRYNRMTLEDNAKALAGNGYLA